MALKSNFSKTLGPGILFASTAIGVSHLVQSTRAGAQYGFALLGLIILANLMKYPFFEYASRYANVTGTSIIDGYKKISKWVLYAYTLITIGSMFFVMAAVGFVTSGFMENLLGLNNVFNYKFATTAILFTICTLILFLGRYSALDTLIKMIGLVLVISTLTAFILTLIHGPVERVADFQPPTIWNDAGLAFIIALLGWMPTALDLSSWNSLWTIERIDQTGYKPSLKETHREFNLGYWVSAGLSICFVTLGAYLIFGSGAQMPQGSAGFASGVVKLYTATIGEWSRLIIGASAFSIMFGTSIAVFDGYARALERCYILIGDRENSTNKSPNSYRFSLLILALGSFWVIAQFGGKSGFKTLIDLATTISFIISPFIAMATFYLVSKKFVGKEGVPPIWMRILSYFGIIFLSLFTLVFLLNKLKLFNL